VRPPHYTPLQDTQITHESQVFANWSQEQTDGTYKSLLYGPLAKFDMECEPLSRSVPCSAPSHARLGVVSVRYLDISSHLSL